MGFFCCRPMSDRESDVQNYRVVHLGRPNPTILRPSQPRPAIMHSLKKSSALQKAPIPIQLRSRPQSLPAMSRTSEETESQARSLFSTSMTPRTRPFSDFPVTYFRDYSASQSFTRSPDENEVPSTPPIPPRNSLRLSKGLRSPNCSKMPNRRHARELSPASVDSAGTEESGGLGINFYDHLGNATRITFRELDLEDLEDLEAKSARGFPGSVFDGQPPTNVSGHASNDLEVPPGPLIEKLLEENYRAQAETFVRNSSRASVRSLALSNHSPSVGSNHSNSSPVTGPATSDTPTRQVSKGESFASNQRSQSLRTPSNKVVVEPFRVKSVSRSGSGFSPEVPSGQRHTTPSTYGHRIYSTPTSSSPEIVKRRYRSSTEPRGPLYFTSQERQAIAELVHAKPRSCDRHTDCTDCTNIEYAYYENKTMPTSMAPEERQKIINNNRSLRNIKNELESLAENGAISDEVYDTIMRSLPAESSLNAPSRGNATPSPSPSSAPSNAFSNLNINNDLPPPSYSNSTPPSLPGSSQPPSKPEIARATALYRYSEPEDCTFEVGDQISVFEYMNADWWLGKNMRTGKEGVFPVNYVQVQAKSPSPGGIAGNTSPYYAYGNEKANGYGEGYPGQYQQQQGPPPPGPSNPYNSSVPPIQMANDPVESRHGKGQEMGKKIGKRLGNAAIFGAGAAIGGGIVNSIF